MTLASPQTILLAIVEKVDPNHRAIDVTVMGSDRQILNVNVVNNPGNYNFPQINDIVLIISTATTSYALGIVQIDYAGKIERKKLKDSQTNKYVRADPVDGGAINIGNIANKTKLTIDNNGDFSFWSSLVAGLKFESLRQILTIASGTLNMAVGTVSSSIGNVFRQMPGTGNTPLQALPPIDSTGIPGFSAVEVFFDLLYKQLRLVRLHLGHILTSKGIPEMSSIDVLKPLRALLEVCFGGTTICSMKMDEGGNIELNTTIGKIVIDSSIPLSSVLLGGLTASQSAVFGDLLKTWLDNHTHPSSWGPTGPASAGPTGPLPTTVLSQKVKIG